MIKHKDADRHGGDAPSPYFEVYKQKKGTKKSTRQE